MKIHHICFQPKIFCHDVDDFLISKLLWLIPALCEINTVWVISV